MDLKLSNNYSLRTLDVVLSEKFDRIEFGPFTIGANFILFRLKSNPDLLLSFVLTGYSQSVGGIYRLVYKDDKCDKYIE